MVTILLKYRLDVEGAADYPKYRQVYHHSLAVRQDDYVRRVRHSPLFLFHRSGIGKLGDLYSINRKPDAASQDVQKLGEPKATSLPVLDDVGEFKCRLIAVELLTYRFDDPTEYLLLCLSKLLLGATTLLQFCSCLDEGFSPGGKNRFSFVIFPGLDYFGKLCGDAIRIVQSCDPSLYSPVSDFFRALCRSGLRTLTLTSPPERYTGQHHKHSHPAPGNWLRQVVIYGHVMEQHANPPFRRQPHSRQSKGQFMRPFAEWKYLSGSVVCQGLTVSLGFARGCVNRFGWRWRERCARRTRRRLGRGVCAASRRRCGGFRGGSAGRAGGGVRRRGSAGRGIFRWLGGCWRFGGAAWRWVWAW